MIVLFDRRSHDVVIPSRYHELAINLINQTKNKLTDAIIQKQIIELIEMIVIYKFPKLSRQEIEAMLKLDELKKTKVYQEALEEGIVQGKIQQKLDIIPLLQELGLTVEQIAERLDLTVKIVQERLN